MEKLVKNIPNIITISRIISSLIAAILFTTGNTIAAISCYVYGAVSDAFDGFLARKLNAITPFGKKIDPISDKLYALSLITPSIILGNYFMILPLVFEAVISSINIYSQIKYKNAYTEKVGKLKTIMLFPTMILGLLATLESYLFLPFVPTLYISLKLQVQSIEVYLEQLSDAKNKYNSNIVNNFNNEEKNSYNNNLNKNIINTNTKYKQKKLIRKKEYNDRH